MLSRHSGKSRSIAWHHRSSHRPDHDFGEIARSLRQLLPLRLKINGYIASARGCLYNAMKDRTIALRVNSLIHGEHWLAVLRTYHCAGRLTDVQRRSLQSLEARCSTIKALSDIGEYFATQTFALT